MSVQSRSGYNEREAKYEPFIAFTSRFKSFVSWPHKGVLQSARNMALAGFFYLGSSDRARCFYCGLTLKDWDATDDPFRSHRQWSPTCAYIATIAEQQLNTGFQSLRVSDRTTSSSGHSRTPVTSGPHNRTVSDSLVRSDSQSNQITNSFISHQGQGNEGSIHVDCPNDDIGTENMMPRALRHPPHIEAVLEMGYTIDVVQRAIDRWREEGKGEFTNASSLMAAIEGWD